MFGKADWHVDKYRKVTARSKCKIWNSNKMTNLSWENLQGEYIWDERYAAGVKNMYNALKYTINSFQNLFFGLVGKTTGNGLTSKEEKKK